MKAGSVWTETRKDAFYYLVIIYIPFKHTVHVKIRTREKNGWKWCSGLHGKLWTSQAISILSPVLIVIGDINWRQRPHQPQRSVCVCARVRVCEWKMQASSWATTGRRKWSAFFFLPRQHKWSPQGFLCRAIKKTHNNKKSWLRMPRGPTFLSFLPGRADTLGLTHTHHLLRRRNDSQEAFKGLLLCLNQH